MRHVLTFRGLWVPLLAIAGCGGSQSLPAEATHESAEVAASQEAVAQTPAQSDSHFALRTPECAGIHPGENIFHDPPSVDPEIADGAVFVRCTPGAQEHIDATSALNALDAAVESTPTTSAPDSLRAQFITLLGLRCFSVASEQTELPAVASVESFKLWWHEGGHDWLAQYLRPVPARAVDSRDRVILFPPTEPRVLSQDTVHAAHPLQRLFCAADDFQCVTETAPFRARLQQSFDAAHNSRILHQDDEHDAEVAACARQARARPAAERYLAWHDCVEGLRSEGEEMPVLHAHAPARGWLVTQRSEQVGDAVTCTHVCAYDFDSGAAHCARACGPSNGSERGDATVKSGRVPLAYLREFGWAMTFADDVAYRAQSLSAYELPAGIEPTWRGDSGRSFGFGGVGSGCSNVVGFAWIVDSCIAQTELLGVSWGDEERRPATAHLGRLFRVLQESFIEGCSSTIPTAADLPTEFNSSYGEVEARLLRAIFAAHPPSCGS